MNASESYVFPNETGDKPAYQGGLIDLVERAIMKAGLRFKLESESARYAIHTHCLRKLFFSKCIGAGIDRGIVEGFMGHKFGLDSSYLRMNDDQLGEEYLKAMPALTFLKAENGETRKIVKAQAQEIERLRERLAKLEAIYSETLKIKES